MDYEEKYKKALERARKIHNETEFDYEKGMMEEIFPELQENEDDRIRKDLIEWIEDFPDSVWRGHHKKDIVAWLEKQGKQEYALKSFKDEDVRKFMQYIEKEAKAYEFNLPNRGYDIYAFAKDILYWLEKQGDNTYSWKPTEEQINALEHFVRSIGESGYASPYDDNIKLLNSLINDLYKLEKQGER